MLYYFKVFIYLMLFQLSYHAVAQTKIVVPKTTRILFILDASGSMLEQWEGKNRMNVAKDVLSKLVDSLQFQKNLELGLRVYGHQYKKKYNNCTDTKLEVAFKPNNHQTIKQKLKDIKPQGTTLISYSLEQSGKDFPVDANARNIIILITDGIESCGGDPCKLAHALSTKHIFLKPFIVGLGNENNFAKNFECMGTYLNAQTSGQFNAILQKIIKQSIAPTTSYVHLLDINGKPTETNVNMTFINTFTDEIEMNQVHYLDANGQNIPIDLDPILTYNIVVNTIPKTVRNNVTVTPGQKNVIEIKTPQGAINFKSENKDFSNLVAIVKQNGKNDILQVHKTGTTVKYLVGTYDIEILTLPRIHLKNFQVNQGTTKTISVPAPGWFQITETLQGYGSIYKLGSNGSQEWVTNLENESSKTAMLLQPGKYRLVFRSGKSKGSEFTLSKDFEIAGGLTTTLKLY